MNSVCDHYQELIVFCFLFGFFDLFLALFMSVCVFFHNFQLTSLLFGIIHLLLTLFDSLVYCSARRRRKKSTLDVLAMQDIAKPLLKC